MQERYERGFRSVYTLTAHTVKVTKYRRRVINQPILERLKQIFEDTCQKWDLILVEFNGESDHVHLLLNYPPHVQLSKLIANLKTVSSRRIRKEFAVEIIAFLS